MDKMLYFFDKQFSFDGGKHWISCFTFGKKLHYGYFPQNEFQHFADFNSAYESLTHLRCSNPAPTTNIFGKRVIRFQWGLTDHKTMTVKNFKSFCMRWYYEPCEINYTMKHLMEELPADEFIEFCKNKGLTFSADVV